jgi:hypothetical protein
MTRALISAFLSFSLGAGALGAAAPDEAKQSEVEILLGTRMASNLPIEGTIVLLPSDGTRDPLRLSVKSLAPLTLSLRPGSAWDISAEIPGFWVRRVALKVGSPEVTSRVSLELWPLGKITGTAKAKPQTPPLPVPRQLLVRTLDPPSSLRKATTPPGAMDCPADENGAWSCTLPAGTFDLAISADGFAPTYRKQVSVLPAGSTPLGAIVLERGGSIAGWVAVDDGAIDPGSCVARLAPVVAGGTSLSSALDLARTGIEQTIGPDGLLHFTGLAPGTYQLQVAQQGYPPIRVSSIRVEASAETFLPEPMVLKKPASLAFEVSPPLDWLGRPWRARIFRIDNPPARPLPIAFEGAVGVDGRLQVPDQASGRYRVDLLDSLDNRWATGEHEMSKADLAPRLLEVRWISVEGRVRLGDVPLRASLWFGGRSGTTSMRMESDEKGRFQGVVPRSGLWRIEVEAPEPVVQTWSLTDVSGGRSDKARVDIELPDTRVFGRVVDERNRPVAHANVLLEGESLDQLQLADDSGSFTVRGLPEGDLWLGAESSSPKGASERVMVSLVEGRATGPLELRLRALDRLAGRVLSPLGPVAGARVLVLSKDPAGGGGGATTESDGSFLAEFPRKSSRVVATVGAPGFALQSFDVPTDSQTLALNVSDSGGTLKISLPGEKDELQRRNLTLAVLQNGVVLPITVLQQWAHDHGQPRDGSDGALLFPNVAPGDYRACLVPRQLAGFLPASGIPEGTHCSSGSLAPGGTLRLSFLSSR